MEAARSFSHRSENGYFSRLREHQPHLIYTGSQGDVVREILPGPRVLIDSRVVREGKGIVTRGDRRPTAVVSVGGPSRSGAVHIVSGIEAGEDTDGISVRRARRIARSGCTGPVAI
jgi:hypothetical protein